MPIILRADMTDHAILLAIAQTYGNDDNWHAFEKDTGAGFTEIPAWIRRDLGDYARMGLSIIEGRKK